jgi:ABC-2 type transport system permease protein
MFRHIFTYRLKSLLRDRTTIFWTIMFPIILAVFFHLALSNLGKADSFEPIDIAVIDNVQYREDQSFSMTLEEASKGEDRLFNLKVVSEDEAKKLLEDGAIKGYIEAGSSINLVIMESGLSQSIIKSFIDTYTQTVSAVKTIISSNPEKAQEVLNSIAHRENYIKEVSATASEPDVVLNFFYSLIAMACFYGGFLGLRVINDTQADISSLAARINVAPIHKIKTFIYSMSAALLIHIVETFTLLAFLRYVLNIDFGSKTGYVLLTTILGSVAGVFMGALISAMVKKSEAMKVAILLAVTMGGSFLAGMMVGEMKYIVAQNLPALSYINPINLLTDALYSLYYYDSLSRYFTNMAILAAYILIFGLGTHLIVRRRKYARL